MKKYNDAYKNASTSRKKKHIARNLRRNTARRVERKCATRISSITEEVVAPRKSQRESSPDEYIRCSDVDNMIAASLRITNRVNNVNVFLGQRYGIKPTPR